MSAIQHLRGIPALAPLRGRRPAVVVCVDDPEPFEARREEPAALDAELLVEREPGPQARVDMGYDRDRGAGC